MRRIWIHSLDIIFVHNETAIFNFEMTDFRESKASLRGRILVPKWKFKLLQLRNMPLIKCIPFRRLLLILKMN